MSDLTMQHLAENVASNRRALFACLDQMDRELVKGNYSGALIWSYYIKRWAVTLDDSLIAASNAQVRLGVGEQP